MRRDFSLRDGFVAFSNAKAVFHQSRLASTTLLHLPDEGGWTG
jgi:hypothetical protein